MSPAPNSARAVSVVASGDARHAVATIMLAFATDPVSRWCFPEGSVYFEHMPAVIDGLGGRAFQHGTGYQADGYAAAALWLPPGVEPDQEVIAAAIEMALPADRRTDVFGVLGQMARYHPTEPHWYLPFIAVDPTKQGQGLGSLLLRHTLALCDRDRLPAYLESSNPINVPLYERHGFRILGNVQYGTSPSIVPMLRPPQ